MKALKAFHEKRESRREERLRREEAAAPMLYPAPELPDAPVENVRFSTRIRNALSAAGMKTIGEARETSDDRLRSLRTLATARSPIFLKTLGLPSTDGVRPLGKKPAWFADLTIPHRGALCVCAGAGHGSLESAMSKTTTFEHGGRIYEVRAIPTLSGWMVRIFIDGIPANGFTYSVNSEIYQDAALNRVPEDLVAGLMETAERDFRRGLLQELMTAEKATDDDIAAEIDKFKPWERPNVRAAELAAKAIDTMVPNSGSADERAQRCSMRIGSRGEPRRDLRVADHAGGLSASRSPRIHASSKKRV
jgi:hypothetical protein